MKPLLLVASLCLILSTAAQSAEATVEAPAVVTMSTTLTKQVGQTVELRLKSGEKMGGKIENVGQLVVHLSQLTGQEFFEAVVAIDQIAAVVMRSKTK